MNCTHEKHEQKFCTRCKAEFTCKVGDVANCQCSGVQFSDNERKYLNETYSDCLCIRCLKAIRQEYYTYSLQQKMKWIIR